MGVIEEIKKKREFSGLPDSIVERVADIKKDDVKESRALLRKYFGVFLTNRIVRGKLSAEDMLATHISSKKRDYTKFYEKIFSGISAARGVPSELETPKGVSSLSGNIRSVIDLGCGVNGFSYNYLKKELGDIDYIGVEATGQLVEQMNRYFSSEGFSAKVIVGDLFDIKGVLKILRKQKKERVVFLFQVVDALENLERDFSKKFILEIARECELIVISLPTESLGGRKKFEVRRRWLIGFLEDNFEVKKDFEMNGERILVIDVKVKNKVP